VKVEEKMAIYKAVLNGQAFGQDVKNILYYRTGVGIDIEGLSLGGTEDVAREIKAQVWPAFRALLPGNYELQDIDVYAYHDQLFNLVYQNPFILSVHELGTRSELTNGPAPCAIVRFDLEPTPLLLDGPKPPKRGYIAYGPMGDNLITDEGYIDRTGGNAALWDALTAALSSNIESLLPPAIFFPIRVHHDKILGVLAITSFADVKNATIRNVASFRRSRQPEL
jgi:hypothetical protein